MDYLKHYNKLMETRKKRIIDDTIYYENHHIIPKCMDGKNDEDNLVKLTFKEHYMAHYFLSKIYPENNKLQYGFLCMLRDPTGKRNLTANMFSTIKNNYRKFCLWYRKIHKVVHSDKGREILRNKMLGDKNPTRRFPEKNNFLGKSYVKGRIWYNNGEKNLYLNSDEEIPFGFIKGMKSYKRFRNGVESSHGSKG